MPDSTDSVQKHPALWQRLKKLVVPVAILLMAVGIVFLIGGNWNTWASERTSQKTDDAYTRADLTPLSTKVAGLVATVAFPTINQSNPEICSYRCGTTVSRRKCSMQKPA